MAVKGGLAEIRGRRSLDTDSHDTDDETLLVDKEKLANSNDKTIATGGETGTFLLEDTMSLKLMELDSSVCSLFEDLKKQSGEHNKRSDTTAWEITEEAARDKKLVEGARKKEREALLIAMERARQSDCRRPLWRWLAKGVKNPNPNQVLKGKALWRATVILVIAFHVRPKISLLQRRARYEPQLNHPFVLVSRCQNYTRGFLEVCCGGYTQSDALLEGRNINAFKKESWI